MTLTEQWKKGELPECEYYIQDKEGNTSTMHLWNDERCKLSIRCKGLSILAPVPSYEEWKAILRALEASYETIINEDKTINRLVHSGKQCNYENTKLKKLLKECRDEIEYLQKHYKGNIDHFKNNTRLDKEINQALGEDK